MSDLACAVCLYEALSGTGATLIGKKAVTIANGQAMCEAHFQSGALGKINDAGGPVALTRLDDPRFDGPR